MGVGGGGVESTEMNRVASTTKLRSLSRLRGRVGVGVPQRVRLFVWREFPHPLRSSSAATSPASGRGEASYEQRITPRL